MVSAGLAAAAYVDRVALHTRQPQDVQLGREHSTMLGAEGGTRHRTWSQGLGTWLVLRLAGPWVPVAGAREDVRHTPGRGARSPIQNHQVPQDIFTREASEMPEHEMKKRSSLSYPFSITPG